jgi:hypothetical protein
MKIFLLYVLAFGVMTFIATTASQPKTQDAEPTPAPIQFHPNAVAKQFRFNSLQASDGAIVCSTLDDVELVTHRETAYAEDKVQDFVTHGQDVLQRGPTVPPAPMSDLGCTLLPKGTPLQIGRQFGAALAVTGYSPDGTLVQGVTHFGMVEPDSQ